KQEVSFSLEGPNVVEAYEPQLPHGLTIDLDGPFSIDGCRTLVAVRYHDWASGRVEDGRAVLQRHRTVGVDVQIASACIPFTIGCHDGEEGLVTNGKVEFAVGDTDRSGRDVRGNFGNAAVAHDVPRRPRPTGIDQVLLKQRLFRTKGRTGGI